MTFPSALTPLDSFPSALGIAPTPPLAPLPSTTETPERAVKPPIDTRVLHLVNGEHFSGAERVQSHLGRCLPAFGVAADFVCVKPGRFAAMLDEQEGRWGRRWDAAMTSRFDLRVARTVGRLVREHQYDLLHAHTPRTAMIASLASRLSGTPWIYHVHSPAARDSAKSWSNRINAWVERGSLRNCSHLITVSNSLRDDCLRSGWHPERITVVHNGVPAIRPVRRSIPVPGEPWTFGMIALMRPRKGLEVALGSLARLRDAGRQVRLRCIGPFETSEYESSIRSQIERLQLGTLVESTGFCRDIPAALAEIDALLLPSLFGEGLPMVVLESLAAAVPVVATRVEGTPEAVRDGVEGLLAEPNDAVSLAARIEELVSGLYDWTTMSEAACQRHQEAFSDVAMARGTADVYRRLLQRSPIRQEPSVRR